MTILDCAWAATVPLAAVAARVTEGATSLRVPNSPKIGPSPPRYLMPGGKRHVQRLAGSWRLTVGERFTGTTVRAWEEADCTSPAAGNSVNTNVCKRPRLDSGTQQWYRLYSHTTDDRAHITSFFCLAATSGDATVTYMHGPGSRHEYALMNSAHTWLSYECNNGLPWAPGRGGRGLIQREPRSVRRVHRLPRANERLDVLSHRLY